MLNFFKLFLITMIFIINSINFGHSSQFSSQNNWKTFKTEHFNIHYPLKMRPLALELSKTVEKYYKTITVKEKWEPSFRVEIVLSDNMDTANGYATSFPYNKIVLYVSRPDLNSTLHNFDKWIEKVFIHEYTHIVNIDKVTGINKIFRWILGRYPLNFPVGFQPIWIIEGNAVNNESVITGLGRNNSNYADMILRMDFLSGNPKTITEASYYSGTWPYGQVPYLYGGKFIDYLEKKYPYKRFTNIMDEASDNFFPFAIFMINTNAYDVYNRSFPSLWNEWQLYQKKVYLNRMNEILEKPLTEYNEITTDGIENLNPRYSNKTGENAVYYFNLSTVNGFNLIKYDLKSKKKKIISKVNSPSSLSSSENKIFMTDMEIFNNGSYLNDIYQFDSDYDKNDLTDKARILYVDSNKKNNITYIKQNSDKYTLGLFQEKKEIPLLENLDIQIAACKINSSGNKILFSYKKPGNYTGIAIYDLESKTTKSLIENNNNNIVPAWHPDENKVIFSSDKNSVYNLYEINLKNKSLNRLTNMVGGAFNPDISKNGGKILFSNYTDKGYDIVEIPYPSKFYGTEQATFKNIDLPASNNSKDKSLPVEVLSEGMYLPFKTLLPYFWFPFLYSNELYEDKYETRYGFVTGGLDALDNHLYSLYFEYGTEDKSIEYNINYFYMNFYPIFFVNYTDSTNEFKNNFPWDYDGEETIKKDKEKDFTAGIIIPTIKFNWQQYINLYGSYEEIEKLKYNPASTPQSMNFNYKTSQFGLYYEFNNMSTFIDSVRPEKGLAFYLKADYYKIDRTYDEDINILNTDYQEGWSKLEISLPGFGNNHVFFTSFRGGTIIDNPFTNSKPFTLGRFEKGEKGSPKDEKERLGLRGFPSGKEYFENIAACSLEYSFPIIKKDFGFSTWPILFRKMHLNLFYEGGNAWDDRELAKKIRYSTGLELHMTLTLGYYLDVSGYIGYARGINYDGENQIYFGVSTFYEGAFENKTYNKYINSRF